MVQGKGEEILDFLRFHHIFRGVPVCGRQGLLILRQTQEAAAEGRLYKLGFSGFFVGYLPLPPLPPPLT